MDKRAAYVEKLSAEMVEWDNRIDRLKDQAKSATPESVGEHSQAIAALQQKRNEAAQKLQGISAAGDHEWEELKTGTDRIWGEVHKILEETVMKIK